MEKMWKYLKKVSRNSWSIIGIIAVLLGGYFIWHNVGNRRTTKVTQTATVNQGTLITSGDRLNYGWQHDKYFDQGEWNDNKGLCKKWRPRKKGTKNTRHNA
jgi:hypothetical protein